MNQSITNPQFDYSIISTDEASKLRYYEGELLRSRKRVAAEMIQHGEILHGAQQALANHATGVFINWLEAVGISTSTAYNAISAFVEFASFPNLENIEVSAMYALAKNSDAKKKAMKLAGKGTKVTHAMAKTLIKQSQPKSPATITTTTEVDSGGDHSIEGESRSEQDAGTGSTDTAADPIEYTPKHPESRHEPTEACPNCGCCWWLTEDGDISCDNCFHPLGEPACDDDHQPLVSPAEVKKALTAVGTLARFFLSCADHSHDDSLAEIKRAVLALESLVTH